MRRRLGGSVLLGGLIAGLMAGTMAFPAAAVEPIKIGFGMGLTGGVAASGRAALLAMKISRSLVKIPGTVAGLLWST